MPDLRQILPEWVHDPLDRLRDRGVPVFAVGGTTRDHLLGRATDDIDLASPVAPPRLFEAFEEAFGETGRREELLGAIEVVRASGDDRPGALVCTSFRVEADYGDDRRPAKVRFVDSVEADATRRDFRVNAIYCEWPEGEWIDPTGGLEDLRRASLSVIGDPVQRLGEDPLRCLRAVRFASQLGFGFDDATRRALEVRMVDIARLSADRIRDELCRALVSTASGPRAYRLCHDLRVFEVCDEGIGTALRSVIGDVERFASIESPRHREDPEATGVLHRTLGFAPFLASLHPIARSEGQNPDRPCDRAVVDRLAEVFNLPKDVTGALEDWIRTLDLCALELSRLDSADPMVGWLFRFVPDEDAASTVGAWFGPEVRAGLESILEAVRTITAVVSADRLHQLGVVRGRGFGDLLAAIRVRCLRGGITTEAQIETLLRAPDLESLLRNRDLGGS